MKFKEQINQWALGSQSTFKNHRRNYVYGGFILLMILLVLAKSQ